MPANDSLKLFMGNVSGCNWLLLHQHPVIYWVPSCSIFYLFNTFHCQSVCNLLPGTGWNKKQWLLLQPLALLEIIFLVVRAATTVPHFHSLPYQMITFCPSWNFCSPCSFCIQGVGFTISCNVPHYTIRIKIRVQPLFFHRFGTTLVTLRYIRITSLVMTLRLFSCQTNSGNQRVSGGWKLDSKYCVYVCVCVYLCAENEKHSKRGMGFKTKIIVLINRLINPRKIFATLLYVIHLKTIELPIVYKAMLWL